ncbi:MAG: hypothetical protein JO250_06735 [Armatimonadetes bacterium]|nr:hypothetical protein [Armatimonadota bacterium]
MNRRTFASRALAKCLAPAVLVGALLPGTALLPTVAQADPPRFYDDNGPDRDWDRGAARGELNWSGDVDDTVIVYVHGRDVRTRTVRGKSANNINTQLSGRLPRGPISVFLRERDGRGSVRVVQQPTPDNDFTAAVRIHDPQRGRSHYNFVLAWRPLSPPPGAFGY